MRRFAVSVFALLLLTAFAVAQNAGEQLYSEKCAVCHGPDGSGQTAMAKNYPVQDLRVASVQSKSDGQLCEAVGRGTGMKTYPHGYEMRGVSKDNIHTIIGHVRTFQPKKKR